jgi:hypothetical protein
MVKNRLTQEQRFKSFKAQHCPYCGADGAELIEIKRGYHGICRNEKCLAENFFSGPKARGWMEAV